jgi:hypothetical protein
VGELEFDEITLEVYFKSGKEKSILYEDAKTATITTKAVSACLLLGSKAARTTWLSNNSRKVNLK